MMRRDGFIKRTLPIVLAVLLIGVLLVQGCDTERRIERFVRQHGEELAATIETDGGIPANIGIRLWNTWNDTHAMTEFILWTRGNTYYGCYYSADDAALAFQNTVVPMEQTADSVWTWRGEGDNRGRTWRIRPQWYGFEASF